MKPLSTALDLIPVCNTTVKGWLLQLILLAVSFQINVAVGDLDVQSKLHLKTLTLSSTSVSSTPVPSPITEPIFGRNVFKSSSFTYLADDENGSSGSATEVFSVTSGKPRSPFASLEPYKAGGACSALYTGENCAKCASGMLRINQKCVSCDAAYGGIVLLVVCVVVYGLYIVANKACSEVLLRCYLGIDAVQLLSLLSTVTLTTETPSFVSTTFNALTVLYVNLFLLVSGCLGSSDTNPAMQFQNIFIAVNLLPVVAVMLLYLLCALYRWPMYSYFIALAAVLSLLYCLLLATSLAVFDCTFTTPDGNYSYLSVLGPMLQGRCGVEGEVQNALVPWAVICGIVYGLGIPLYLYEVYKYCRRNTDTLPTNDVHTVCAAASMRAVLWLLYSVVRKGVVLVVLYLTDSSADGDGGRIIGLVVVLVTLYVSYVGVGCTDLSQAPDAPNDPTNSFSHGWLAPQPKQRVLVVLSGIATVLVRVLSMVNDHNTCLVVAVLLMMLLGVTVLYALCVSIPTLDTHIETHKTSPESEHFIHAEGSLPTDLEAGYAQTNLPIDIENPMKLRLNSGFSSELEVRSGSGDDGGNGSGGKDHGLDAFFSRDMEPGCIDHPSEWYPSTIHSGDNNGSYDSDWMGMLRLESGNSSISSEEDLFAPPSPQHTASVNDIIPVPVVPASASSRGPSTPNYSEYNRLDSPRYSMENPWMDGDSSGAGDNSGVGVVGVAPGDSMVYFTEPTESYGIEDESEGTVLDTDDHAGNRYAQNMSDGVDGGGGDYDMSGSEFEGGDEGAGEGSDEGIVMSGPDSPNEEVSTALPNMNMRYLTLRHMDTPHRPVHALPSPKHPVQYVEYMFGQKKSNRKW